MLRICFRKGKKNFGTPVEKLYKKCCKRKTHRFCQAMRFGLWREPDSNRRPLGYEPSELPLLYPAMFYGCKGSDFPNTTQAF